MNPFRYQRAVDIGTAISTVAADLHAQFIAGGTSQVDLMKEGVQRPGLLVDISRLPLAGIEQTSSGGLRIGANTTNAFLADNFAIRARYRAVSEAVLAGALHQIRNVATTAGNLLQRTRCPYLRHPDQSCNKRDPGTGCSAVNGFNRMHAIFGATDEGANHPCTCIAAHPSDLAVAFAAHEAIVVTQGPNGARRIAFDALLRLPGNTPHIDSNLLQGELITAIELPAFNGNSHYLKVRDRASYAYALVSCAVAITSEEGRITSARIALGSVGPKPWRAFEAENLLEGQLPDKELFQRAAEQALEGARTYAMNDYKPRLARAVLVRALTGASGLEPLQGPAGTVFASSVGGVAGAEIGGARP